MHTEIFKGALLNLHMTIRLLIMQSTTQSVKTRAGYQ